MQVERVPEPLIQVGDDDTLGKSIHFPSVIRVPEWVDNPLGKYYLYFSHHHGEYIRLAYADSITGPWSIYQPGALNLSETQFPDRTMGGTSRLEYRNALFGELSNTLFRFYRLVAKNLNRHLPLPHISSPEVFVDDDSKEIRLYYHGLDVDSATQRTEQFTRVGVSDDGISFTSRPEKLGNPYFRVFQWEGQYYALAQDLDSEKQSERGVTIYRSKDGTSGFELGPTILKQGVRHTGVRIKDNTLEVYFSRIGDTPERVLKSDIKLSKDWDTWSPSEPICILQPEIKYEGADIPLEPSGPGGTHKKRNELRDPDIFVENSGDTYLFYTIGGESGIALAKLYY